MQNLDNFGVYDVDETGRSIGTIDFWEWEPEGRWPPYEEHRKWRTIGVKPKTEKPKPGKGSDAQPGPPPTLDDLMADYDKRREWFKERFRESELHLHGVKDKTGEGCSKRLSPGNFASRIEKFGMRTDALNDHLPPWPSKEVWQHKRDRELARLVWKDFFTPLNVCAGTLEGRLPSRPQRSEYVSEQKWMTSEKNWINLFTDEPAEEYRGTIPTPDRPTCPRAAMKKLAQLGKHLKDVEGVPKEDEKWALLDTYASELLEKRMCRDQILVVLAKPSRKAYSSLREWWSDRRKWNKYIASLEKGEDVPLPKLDIDSVGKKQPARDQPAEGEHDRAKDQHTTKGKLRGKDFPRTRLDTIPEAGASDEGEERAGGDDSARDEGEGGVQDHEIDDHGVLDTIPERDEIEDNAPSEDSTAGPGSRRRGRNRQGADHIKRSFSA
ncbi:uncharacterized protein PV07_02906 [Cladophialophora immunda]|uniref:Uncharacterized protein n=1 Tax=Cladophialophora immunda TaxID=569365 RepID=A0A0D2B0V4_9EURO|nr:uncharacterized protein PV07_02906 [Cladophialophora immunda]KIW31242.1 hypothetical protein PV07_02906 [Cladophialophora immunda]